MSKITNIENHILKESEISLSSINNQGEIDLIEVFQLLWKKKKSILVVMCCCFVIGLLYAFLAPQQWSSQAWLLPPRIEQLQSYITERQEYARIMHQNFDEKKLQSDLFALMLQLAASPIKQQQFLRSTGYFKRQTQGMSPQEQQRWLAFYQNKIIKIILPDDINKQRNYQFSMQADQAGEAQQLLADYIDFVSQQALSLNRAEFISEIQAAKLTLLKEKRDVVEKLTVEKKNNLQSLENDYMIAKKGGIVNYYSNEKNNVQIINNQYRFLLGEKLLESAKNTLSHSPLLYPYRYQQIIEQLDQFAKFSFPIENNKAYSYDMPPTFPFQRDEPKRALIIMLSLFIGVLLGSIGVLSSFHLTKQRR